MSPLTIGGKPRGVTSDGNGGYLRSQGGVTSDPTSLTSTFPSGRGTTTEGEEKAANAAPPPPTFPDQCSRHQQDYNDAPCRGCKRQRESNEAAAKAAAANDPVQQL